MRKTAVLAAFALCAGCVPVPVVLPSWDTPPDIAPTLPAEFSTAGPDTLVIVVRSAEANPAKGMIVFDQPLFISPEKLPAIAEQLGRKGVYVGVLLVMPYGATGGGGSSVMPVRELCLVSAGGRTVSLFRRYGTWSEDRWQASAPSAVDAVWRDQFAALVAQPRHSALLPIWQSSPCRYVDWTRPFQMQWTGEERARVVEFLKGLPLKK